MKYRFWTLVLFLLSSVPAVGDVTTTVVRIAAQPADGAAQQGTGFVVALSDDRRMAHVVTAAHVVEGSKVEVFFASSPFEAYPAKVLFLDGEADLALLKVERPPQAQVASISLGDIRAGAALEVAGYPNRSKFPRLAKATASSIEGAQLVLQLAATGGNSGGPVFSQGLVVGLVKKDEGGTYTHAVPAPTLRIALDSWRVAFNGVWPGQSRSGTNRKPEVDQPTFHGKIGVGLLEGGAFSKELSALARSYLSKNLKGERVVLLDASLSKSFDEIIYGDLNALARHDFASEGIDFLLLGDGRHSKMNNHPFKTVRLDFQLYIVDVNRRTMLDGFSPCAQAGAGGSDSAALDQALGRCLEEVVENFGQLTNLSRSVQ